MIMVRQLKHLGKGKIVVKMERRTLFTLIQTRLGLYPAVTGPEGGMMKATESYDHKPDERLDRQEDATAWRCAPPLMLTI